jgi:hypothetical protein
MLIRRVGSLCGMAFYTYDLIRDIVILLKVFSFQQWYGFAVLTVMLVHHAYRGVVVSLYLAHTYHGKVSPLLRNSLVVVCAPVVMVFTLVMDFWSFLHILGMPSPAILGVEGYSRMRSLVIAVCQSLPLSVIITIIFSLGTRPSDGDYLSNRWYVLSFGGSALSMLWGLHVWLSLSRVRNEGAMQTWVLIMTGGLLCPEGDSRYGRALDCGLHAWRGDDSHEDRVRLYMRVTVLGTVSASLLPRRDPPAAYDEELELAKILAV